MIKVILSLHHLTLFSLEKTQRVLKFDLLAKSVPLSPIAMNAKESLKKKIELFRLIFLRLSATRRRMAVFLYYMLSLFKGAALRSKIK